MKKSAILVIGMIVIISCQKEQRDACDIRNDISAPPGFEINTVGEINFNGSIKSFQFVSEQTGFALGANQVGGYVDVFKTTDGGQTWSDLEININQHPRNMFFKDENFGIITVNDVTGCPNNCQRKCVILVTENGGSDWVEVELKGLQGILYHPSLDNEGNLYAYLNGVDRNALMKSADNGSTWDTVFTSPEMNFELVTFSFHILKERLFISAKDGRIIVTDLGGQYLKTIKIDEPPVWDMEIIDDDNLVVFASEKVIKSTDGGKTWSTIYGRSARLIGFESAEQGLVILEKGICFQGCFFQSNDLIAYTSDGGRSWVEPAETTTNLRREFVNSQHMGEGAWYVMTGKKLIEIRKLN
jgi:photosystem II stability/assembly factor-like uncharacterized protein